MRKWLRIAGVLGAIFGGWQVGTLEYQPGPLLTWGNVFFYGDFEDIPSDGPTLDRWFNVDAGFERDPAKRVDIINLPNRTTFANPNLNSASTDFGRITSATAASPRFVQFVSKFTF